MLVQVQLLKKGEEVPAELAAKVEAAQKANAEASEKAAAGDGADVPSSPAAEDASSNTAPLKDKVSANCVATWEQDVLPKMALLSTIAGQTEGPCWRVARNFSSNQQ